MEESILGVVSKRGDWLDSDALSWGRREQNECGDRDRRRGIGSRVSVFVLKRAAQGQIDWDEADRGGNKSSS